MSAARRWLIRFGKLLVIAVVTWGLFRATGLTLAELDTDELARLRPSPWLLAASTAGLFGAYLGLAALWRRIMGDLTGTRIPRAAAYRIFFVSNLGRYVPGKIWQVAGMAILARQAGVPAVAATAAAILGQLAFLSTGVVFTVVVLPGWLEIWPFLAVAALGLAAGIAVFRLGGRGLRVREWFGRRLGIRVTDVTELTGRVGWRHAATWLAGYAGAWLVVGSAFVLFTMAFVPQAAGEARHVAGSIGAAYLVGYAAFFAPAGIGFREGVMGVLLAQVIPAPAAVVVAVASRLWFTAVELLALAAVPFLPRASGTASSPTTGPGQGPGRGLMGAL